MTTSGYGGKGIDINTANTSSNLLIKNNFIQTLKGDGWSSLTLDAIVGIRIGASTVCGGIKLYNNTINLGPEHLLVMHPVPYQQHYILVQHLPIWKL